MNTKLSEGHYFWKAFSREDIVLRFSPPYTSNGQGCVVEVEEALKYLWVEAQRGPDLIKVIDMKKFSSAIINENTLNPPPVTGYVSKYTGLIKVEEVIDWIV